MAINKLTGHGFGSSAAKLESTVTPRATKLQMPIAVALLVKGKILFSVKEAWYAFWKVKFTPILVKKTTAGMQ